MTNHTELKRLVDLVLTDRRFCGDENHKALAAGVQALIAENERLSAACTRAEQVINAESKAAAIATGRANLLQAERDQLRAELDKTQLIGRLAYNFDGYKAVLDEREHLRVTTQDALAGQMALASERDLLKAENELLASSRAKLAGELSRLRAKHKDWSADAAMGKGEQS